MAARPTIKCRGGHNVLIKGAPSLDVRELPVADVLRVPLFSRRFNFSDIRVKEGDQVRAGQVLAQDPDNFSIPLLAPANGTAKPNVEGRCVAIENVRKVATEKINIDSDMPETAKTMGANGKKHCALVRLGAWQFFSDARTGKAPDPYRAPRAVIVTTACLEPFVADIEAVLRGRLPDFMRGLEILRSLAGPGSLFIIVRNRKAGIVGELRNMLEKWEGATLVEVPPRYPFGHPKLLVSSIDGQVQEQETIWALNVEAVLAVDQALTSGTPVISRIISVAGPGSKDPAHVSACAGYPLDRILDGHVDCSPARIIDGGVFTGRALDGDQAGLDTECVGLTVVPENTKREVLAFAQPGFGWQSRMNAFASALLPRFKERFTTAVRGEPRPCLQCGSCEDVCPAGIMPNLIYRHVNKRRTEDALRFDLRKCVRCGLCAYVCPSKIEHLKSFIEAEESLDREASPEGNRT